MRRKTDLQRMYQTGSLVLSTNGQKEAVAMNEAHQC